MSLRKHLRPIEYCNKLKDKLVNQKLIRKDDNVLRESLETVFIAIDMINALPEDATRVMGRDLDEIEIISELSDMIYPEVVRIDSTSRRCLDVVFRQEEVPEDEQVSYSEFMEAQAYIRSAYKRDDNEGLVKVSTLRVKKNLSEVLDRAVWTEFERKGVNAQFVNQPKGQSFYPIYIKHTVLQSLYSKNYFNDNLEEMLNDLVISKSFK